MPSPVGIAPHPMEVLPFPKFECFSNLLWDSQCTCIRWELTMLKVIDWEWGSLFSILLQITIYSVIYLEGSSRLLYALKKVICNKKITNPPVSWTNLAKSVHQDWSAICNNATYKIDLNLRYMSKQDWSQPKTNFCPILNANLGNPMRQTTWTRMSHQAPLPLKFSSRIENSFLLDNNFPL